MKIVKSNQGKFYQLTRQDAQNLEKNFHYTCCKKELQLGHVAFLSGVNYNRLRRMVGYDTSLVPQADLDAAARVLEVTVSQLIQHEEPNLSERTDGIALHAGEVIKAWRSRCKLSQKDVAQEVGLFPGQVSAAERGIDVTTIDTIAKFLAPTAVALATIRKFYKTPMIIKANNAQYKVQAHSAKKQNTSVHAK